MSRRLRRDTVAMRADGHVDTDGWMIPDTWRCAPGELTPDGTPAVFHATPHAVMAIRLRYRREILEQSDYELADKMQHYQWEWDTFVENATAVTRVADLVVARDLDGAGALWKQIDQPATDGAFRVVLAEGERYRGRNLITHAWKHYGDSQPQSVPKGERDRGLRPKDNNAAWDRSHGVCTGCGILTLEHSTRVRLHRAIEAHPDLFDTSPTRTQHNGKRAPLWPSITIAAKGVAEHVVPRSQGGPTTVANLTNTCAGCNYARGDASLDAMRVVAYERPPSELL